MRQRPADLQFFDPHFCASSPLPDFLAATLDAARQLSSADMGTLQLLEQDSLKLVEHEGFSPSIVEFFKTVTAEDHCSCAEVMRHLKPVRVPDIEISPVFDDSSTRPILREANIRAVHSVPLRANGGSLLGVVSVHFKSPLMSGDGFVPALDILARRAATWIEWKRGR